jgi:hypothetical protein
MNPQEKGPHWFVRVFIEATLGAVIGIILEKPFWMIVEIVKNFFAGSAWRALSTPKHPPHSGWSSFVEMVKNLFAEAWKALSTPKHPPSHSGWSSSSWSTIVISVLFIIGVLFLSSLAERGWSPMSWWSGLLHWSRAMISRAKSTRDNHDHWH